MIAVLRQNLPNPLWGILLGQFKVLPRTVCLVLRVGRSGSALSATPSSLVVVGYYLIVVGRAPSVKECEVPVKSSFWETSWRYQ